MALKKLRSSSVPPPKACTHSAVPPNCTHYHTSFSSEMVGGPNLSKEMVSQVTYAVSNMTSLTKICLLAEQIFPRGQLVVPRPDFSKQQRKAGGGTLSLGSPRNNDLRRKELLHQFREEHQHTRKQAVLSAFPFLTQCIYTQENAAHMQYRPRLERLYFHYRRRHMFLKAFSMLALFCTQRRIHNLKRMLDFGAKGHN